jgi:hypothetical protein
LGAFLLFWFCFCGAGYWTQASTHVWQTLYHWATSPVCRM